MSEKAGTVSTATKSQIAEVQRLLAIPESDRNAPKILQLEHEICASDDPADKRRVTSVYRIKSLLIHPDRCGHDGATEAFAILGKAYEDVLSGRVGPAPGSSRSSSKPSTKKAKSEDDLSSHRPNFPNFSTTDFNTKMDARIAKAARAARRAQDKVDRIARDAEERSYRREQHVKEARDRMSNQSANDYLHERVNKYGASLDNIIDGFIAEAGNRADQSNVSPMLSAASRSRSNEEMQFWHNIEAAQKREIRKEEIKNADQQAMREDVFNVRNREKEVWDERLSWQREALGRFTLGTGQRRGGFGNDRDEKRRKEKKKKRAAEKEAKKKEEEAKRDGEMLAKKVSSISI